MSTARTICVVLVGLATLAVGFGSNRHVVMPWLCLERCGFNSTQIEQHVWTIKQKNREFANKTNQTQSPLVNAVAFEIFNLGPNSTLIQNPLYDVNTKLKTDLPEVKRIAMISSYPYPPQFLDWMRALFQNTTGFFDALIQQLVTLDIDGVNVDFEPTSAATVEDGKNFATFLGQLRVALSAAGKYTTVAAARWSYIWNFTAIAEALTPTSVTPTTPATAFGFITTMNTYTYRNSTFARELAYNIDVFGLPNSTSTPNSLVVGLETWPNHFTSSELEQHFDLLRWYGVCQIALWDMPIQPLLWGHIDDLVARCI